MLFQFSILFVEEPHVGGTPRKEGQVRGEEKGRERWGMDGGRKGGKRSFQPPHQIFMSHAPPTGIYAQNQHYSPALRRA